MNFKKILTLLAASLCCCASLLAQGFDGGVRAKVVNRSGRTPISGAQVSLVQGGELVAQSRSAEDGAFEITGLANGQYELYVRANGFADALINVSVEGFVRDLIFVSLVAEQVINEVDDSNFAEFDMEDSGYSDSPSILFGSNDPYNSIVGYGFSDVRFKNRGYNSESQNVLFSGVRLNDAITGYTPFSLWSGLNEATRSKDTSTGLETHDNDFGGYNGVTNIIGTPSSVRPGWRFSVLTNSALYRARLMTSYASGLMDNGWSYAFNLSARLGGNDWVQGIYYKSLAYYFGAEKKLGDAGTISFVTFATPGQRGAQNASTQEVYDLMGDNMYNSNWGYQNGKLRNARVRSTFEPVFAVTWKNALSDELELGATVLFRTGKNGYSALDWYNAADPRPDYYRNLPSYFFDENDDMNRYDSYQAAAQREAWLYDENTQHLNWDALYNVNYNAEDGRSKYILQERRTDQNDLNFALSTKWTPTSWFTLNGGLNARINRTEYFETVKDLLGGDHYLNVNNFAERDFAFSAAKIQYDLDYYLAHGEAQTLKQGDKYGYDYYAQVRNLSAFANAKVDILPNLKASLAAKVGYESFWRDGLMRNGLFPGLDANGNPYIVDGVNLTADGGGETSYGKSDKAQFLVGGVKAYAEYDITGNQRVYANAGFFADAPKFNGAFIAPRTRNTLMSDLTTAKTLSADINYQYSGRGYEVRATAFYTTIKDQTDLMSFYDDSQNSFTNFAMSGIDQRHMGIELGFKVPTPVSGLNVQGALSWGEYIYTSTPLMTQTIDNSANVVVDHQPVTYWASHPVYAKDADGAYIVEDGVYKLDHVQKHYVPSTPQLAGNLALNYRTNSYWFFTLGANVYAHSYLDMNPLYRTELAVVGPDDRLNSVARAKHRNTWYLNESMVDQGLSPEEIEYMPAQEAFDPAVVLNLSIGKSWYINRKYNFGFSLESKNLLNDKNIKTGGYEQTRLIDSGSYTRYYRFDSKYFYMAGMNYMLNLYFRF